MSKSLFDNVVQAHSKGKNSLEKARPRVISILKQGVGDLHNRPLRDLRISVTDKCNFRCTYCMPREVFGPDYEFLAQQQLLSFEEITRVAKLCVNLGVQKIRLTGASPCCVGMWKTLSPCWLNSAPLKEGGSSWP